MEKKQSASKTFFNVLKYIINNNALWRVPLVLGNAFLFHFFVTFLGRTTKKKLFNGKQILLFPNCNISSMLIYAKLPDEDEIMLLRKRADNETVFLDIGANVGLYSIALADKVGDVIAFEPHPFTASRCRKNFSINNLSENNVKEIALSSRSEKIFFSDYGGSSTVNKIVEQSENTIEVQAMTLDEFASLNNFSKEIKYLMKIDVEGFELEVLKGAQNFLKDYNIEAIVFECFGHQKELVSVILEKHGFKISRLSTNNYYAVKG